MSLAKYIVNIDELAGAFGDREIKINAEISAKELEALLKRRFDDLTAAAGKTFEGYRQLSHGLQMDIPALAFDYELLHTFDTDVYIAGITYSQTGWKPLDMWSVYIDEQPVFDGLYTKELGEHKRLSVFRAVSAGAEIKIVHHNKSGNSKRIWFDIDYLIKT